MSGAQAMKRIPRIKFPQRHPKPQGSTPATEQNVEVSRLGFTFQPKTPPSATNAGKFYRFSSEVPAPPTNTGVGGKASMLPKRTPVSEKEIEAILLSGEGSVIQHDLDLTGPMDFVKLERVWTYYQTWLEYGWLLLIRMLVASLCYLQQIKRIHRFMFEGGTRSLSTAPRGNNILKGFTNGFRRANSDPSWGHGVRTDDLWGA